MKIAVLTSGTRGDVQPFIALSRTLKARGHEVLLAAPDNFATWVGEHGLEFRPMGTDFQALLQTPDGRQIISGNWFALARVWRKTIVPMIHASLDATWHAAREADIIVHHPKAGGALDVAEATGAKAICASTVPIFPTEAFPVLVLSGDYGPALNLLTYKMLNLSRFMFRKTVNQWRKDSLGLQAQTSNALYDDSSPKLCAVSPAVVPLPDGPSRGVHMTGYWFLDEGEDWQPDEALAAFLAAGPPPVYIGFGSLTTVDPAKLTRKVMEGVERAGLRAILATGWGGLEQTGIPDTVHIIESAPHDALFKQVCAVVHHGGAGSTAAGLRAGRPTLVCPQAVDQPFWGRRVRALGCGPEPQSLRRLTAERFGTALQDLVGTKTYQQRAADVAEAIASEDGIGNAVRLIEAAGL